MIILCMKPFLGRKKLTRREKTNEKIYNSCNKANTIRDDGFFFYDLELFF